MECHYNNFFNTLGPKLNGRHLPDSIFLCILLNENVWTSIESSLKFIPNGLISNIPALIQINGLARARRQAIIWSNDI